VAKICRVKLCFNCAGSQCFHLEGYDEIAANEIAKITTYVYVKKEQMPANLIHVQYLTVKDTDHAGIIMGIPKSIELNASKLNRINDTILVYRPVSKTNKAIIQLTVLMEYFNLGLASI